MRDLPPPLPSHGAGWFLRLFGGIEARCADGLIDRFPSRAVAALCARLAMYPDTVHGREELADLLWPDADGPSGANRLRNALSTLKRLLTTPALSGHAFIIADRRGLRANPSLITSDVAQFDRLVSANRLHEAAQLCRGELLPGFYDEWIIDERRRLSEACERVRRGLAPAEPRPAAADAHAAPTALAGPRPAAPAPDASSGAESRAWRRVPRLPDTFFGREREIAAIEAALGRSRLVVIRGPAGCGKSRLALEFAAMTGGFDLVAWVPLLSCSDPTQVFDQVRASLALERAPGLPLDQIAARLEGRRALLIFDNLEHLLRDGRAPFLAILLRAVPSLRLLVTSQQRPAGTRGYDLQLPMLPLPAPRADLPAAWKSPAVRLFVDRARQRRADFTLHAGNVAAITSICELVQGLPLAVELAAASVRKLPLQAIGRSLDVAAGAAVAAAQPRHTSMAAALGWSWRLLPPAHQHALCLLSEFRGSFDAQAAAQVFGVRADRAAARLRTLAHRSWLQAAGDDPVPRWTMLSVNRQFAQERASAAAARTARTRHRQLFLSRARVYGAESRTVPAAELPDHLQAIEKALAEGAARLAAAHALALRAHFIQQGASEPALALLRALAQSAGIDAESRCDVAALLAPLLLDAGHADEAQQLAADARARAATLAPHARLAAEIAWIHVVWRSARDGATLLAPARAAMAQADSLGDAALIGRAAMLLGAIVWAHLKDSAEARDLFAAAEAAFRRCGDVRAAAATLPGRVACLLTDADLHAAIELCEAGFAEARRHDDVQTEVLLLNRLTEATARLGRNTASVRAGRRLVELAAKHGMAYHLAYGLWNLTLPLARLGRVGEAARLMAFSRRYWSERFGGLGEEDERYVQRVRDGVVRRVGLHAWEELWRAGERLTSDAAIAIAMGDSDGSNRPVGSQSAI
jgi:predicted ATPase